MLLNGVQQFQEFYYQERASLIAGSTYPPGVSFLKAFITTVLDIENVLRNITLHTRIGFLLIIKL